MGFDPYDALNSQIFHVFPFNQKYIRIIATQVLKWSPVNFRKLLGIQKGFNPKALGLFLRGYVQLYSINRDIQYKQKIEFLSKKLLELQSSRYSGLCWGYNFPWHNRGYFFPRYTPTIVNTSFIGHGFLDAFEVFGEERYFTVAKSACEFILNDLNIVIQNPHEMCLSYTPLDHTKVYNSNALGASFLARVGSIENNQIYLSAAKKMANFVFHAQNPDGSWFYGEHHSQKWIDIHHTGFILESLYQILKVTHDLTYYSRIEKGLKYFIQSFICPDGQLKSWNDRIYPV
jgi:hypothetical protein